MSTMHTILEAMPPEARGALLAHSHRVTFPAGTRIVNERRRAAVIADRPDSARPRLLDLFAPHGSGTPLASAR
ncbi:MULTISPECIES: hypothetical protein [unclassified Streptomyces]|uniref:hypothetical protein n=1 Tax=unclassified Streptomyces TaxID=2593676 RepID=UPI0004C4C8E9|nr:hypothetical protein [Streptomyces sp. NRRL F-2747]